MEKLTVHEILRMYLPGLFLSLLIYFFATSSIDNIGNVALPAIFVGLVLDQLLFPFHLKRFKSIIAKEKFGDNNQHINLAVRERVNKQFKLNVNDFKGLNDEWGSYTEDDLTIIYRSLHNRINFGDRLSLFRLPKSFAILFFNLAVICLGFGVFLTLFGLYIHYHKALELYDILWVVLLFSAHRLFLNKSDIFFKTSLDREYAFYKSLSNEELIILSNLIKAGR